MALSLLQLLTAAERHIQHWTSANAPLGGNPIRLRGGQAVADLTAALATLRTLVNGVVTASNSVQTASGTLADRKRSLAPRAQQFRRSVEGIVGAPGYINALPPSPRTKDGRLKFVQPLIDMRELWTAINADTTVPGFTPPLVLPGGYTLAMFTAEVAAVEAAYAAHNGAAVGQATAIARREQQRGVVMSLLTQYRAVIAGRYTATDPVATSLPRLHPPRGGTPKPVTNLLFTVRAADGVATVTFTPSTSANIARYEARFSPGEKYDADNEAVVATGDASATSLSFPLTMVAPGDTALVKIYAVTATDNERGSAALKIRRPA